MKQKFGFELVTGYGVQEILGFVERALNSYDFDYIGVTDNTLTSNPFVTLGAIAKQFEVSVGTLVTYPFGRNPYELATAFTSISELNSKAPYVGIGSGGLLQRRIFNVGKAFALTREASVLLKRLFAGELVEPSDYPELSSLFRLQSGVKSKLLLPPKKKIPIYIAAHGPKALEMTGMFADGLIIRSTSVGGLSGIRKNYLKRLIDKVEAAKKRAGNNGVFERFYTTTFSVDNDLKRAKQVAKRGISYQLAESLIGMDLKSLGMTNSELKIMREIREDYKRGTNMLELAEKIPDSIVDKGFLIVGTPKKCLEEFAEVLKETRKYKVHHTLAFPVGSDMVKSIGYLTEYILPSI